jgi:hypothetical protein
VKIIFAKLYKGMPPADETESVLRVCAAFLAHFPMALLKSLVERSICSPSASFGVEMLQRDASTRERLDQGALDGA